MRNNHWHHHDHHHHGRGLWNGIMLVCIGCVLIAIGLNFGGSWNSPGWLPWEWHWNSNGMNRMHERGPNNGSSEQIYDIPEMHDRLPADLKSIDIKLKAASLVIHTGSDVGYRATDFGKDSLRIRKEGNLFVVEEKSLRQSVHLGRDFPHPVLEITLPEGIVLARCDISVGAGTVAIEDLDADSLDIESGAGSINGTKVSARKVDLRTGAGALEFTKAVFGKTRIETAAGRVAFSGDLSEEAKIATGAGEVELALSGAESLYRIDYERGLGSVKIGSESYNGIGRGSYGNHDAKRHLELETGLGAVRVSFAR